MGIGAATARALADAGATVWAVARTRDRLDSVAGKHRSIHPVVADLTLAEDRERLLHAVVGDVDLLVNNAGIGASGTIAELSMDHVRRMFELNVLAAIELTKAVLPGMLQRHRGHVCNVGSSMSYFASPPLSTYAATKFAIHGFTDGLRRELMGTGVHTSLILPGPVRTGFWDRSKHGDRPEVRDRSGQGTTPEHVARAIVRAVQRDRLPGYSTIAVPRAVGAARLLDLPGIGFVADRLSSRFAPRSV